MTDCWRWPGPHRASDGRPMLGKRYAYKVIWEAVHGPTPLKLHHRCENKWCVNPAHLEPITQGEHIRRHGWTGDHHQRDKTHCPAGHPYDDENTYVYTTKDGRIERRCRACTIETKRRWRARVARTQPGVVQ